MTKITAGFTGLVGEQAQRVSAGLKLLGLSNFCDREAVIEIENPSEQLVRMIALAGSKGWEAIDVGPIGIVFYVTNPVSLTDKITAWDGYFLLPFASIKSICSVSDDLLDDAFRKLTGR